MVGLLRVAGHVVLRNDYECRQTVISRLLPESRCRPATGGVDMPISQEPPHT